MENGHLCSLWSYWQLWPGIWRLWGCNNRWRVSYIKSQNSQILVLIYSLLDFHFPHHFYYLLPLPWSEIYCLVPYPTSTTSRLILESQLKIIGFTPQCCDSGPEEMRGNLTITIQPLHSAVGCIVYRTFPPVLCPSSLIWRSFLTNWFNSLTLNTILLWLLHADRVHYTLSSHGHRRKSNKKGVSVHLGVRTAGSQDESQCHLALVFYTFEK